LSYVQATETTASDADAPPWVTRIGVFDILCLGSWRLLIRTTVPGTGRIARTVDNRG
jgi:hypothetical protein